MDDNERQEVAFAARMNEAVAILDYVRKRFEATAELLISVDIKPSNRWLTGIAEKYFKRYLEQRIEEVK